MKAQNVIVVVLCLFMTGCSSKFRFNNFGLEARKLMNHAAALADSSSYHQAAKEYAKVAEYYPSTSYYKPSVWKAALLNIHPDNPQVDYAAARHWIKVYLELPLSPEEKETATIYGALIAHINDMQSELSDLGKKKSRLMTITREQSQNIKALTQALEKVEDELKKMKAVDVRMHLNRGNRIDPKTIGSVQKTSKSKNDKTE